jgi:hypothetical protein
MTTTHFEGFEGVANGAPLTVSNTSFDFVTDGEGLVGTTTDPIHGNVSALCTSPAFRILEWSDWSGYTQAYFKLLALPSTAIIIGNTRAGASNKTQLRLLANGTLQLRNGTTAVAASTTEFHADSEFSVQWRVNETQQELRIFVDNILIETISGAATAASSAAPTTMWWGVGSSNTGGQWLLDSVSLASDWPALVFPSGGTVSESHIDQIYAELGADPEKTVTDLERERLLSLNNEPELSMADLYELAGEPVRIWGH